MGGIDNLKKRVRVAKRGAHKLRFPFLLLISLGMSLPAHALDVTVDSSNMGPLGVSSSVYLTGPIVVGDAEKVWNAIRTLDIQTVGARLHVTISSPGGSVTEALKIGRLLNKLPSLSPITVTSSVGIRGEPLDAAGDCASACVLIYLGATYRYLNSDSRLGVHQFSFGNSGISSADAASSSQLLAADVTEYLREVRVDQSLFTAMSTTLPENIHWVNHDWLKEMRVVNENILDESSEYKNVDGTFYLLLWQQSYYGENKIVALCNSGKVVFIAYLQPPDLAEISERNHKLTVVADGEEFAPAWNAIPKPTERFATAEFSLNPSQLARFASARSVGARMMVPGAGLFFGFEMKLPDTKLHDVIVGCSKPAQ